MILNKLSLDIIKYRMVDGALQALACVFGAGMPWMRKIDSATFDPGFALEGDPCG
jgi:hypothetical protein